MSETTSKPAPFATPFAAPAAEDLRALSWLQKEVQHSLDVAHKSVQRHLREALALRGASPEAQDTTILRAACSHLHQAAGALELADQRPPALLLRAAEQAVRAAQQKPAAATGELALALERAGFALNDYLTRLTVGKPVHGVSLFAPYRGLMRLASAERIHPADLWEHDWRWCVIANAPQSPALPAGEDGRETMERLVLRLMRAPDRSTLQRMSDLCAAWGAQAQGRSATMWRLAAGFFEAQAAGLVRQDLYVKRAASRLLAQARVGLGAGEVSEQLAKDMLFFCAGAADPGPGLTVPRWRAVRQAFGLETCALPDYEALALGRVDPAWVTLARKRLSAAREAWASVAAGDKARLRSLVESFALVQESLEKLYPQGMQLGQALARATQSVVATGAVPAALAMEVATTILYLEASLDSGDLDEAGLGDRILRLTQRVEAVRQGQEPEPVDSWMESLYRRVADGQTLKTVVQELRSSLARVEQIVDSHLRNPQAQELLLPAPPLLDSMRGALGVLGLVAASQAVAQMRQDVLALTRSAAAATAAEPFDQKLFDRLADNLGALNFTVDILAVQPELAKTMFSFDAQAGLLRTPAPEPVAERVVEPVVQPVSEPVSAQAEAAPTAETADARDGEMLDVFFEESAEVLKDARTALEALGEPQRDTAEDLSHMIALRRAFHTLKGSSRMVGLADLGGAAWACEQLFNARLAQSASPDPDLCEFTLEALNYLEDWTDAIAEGKPRGHETAAVVTAAESLRLSGRRLSLPLPATAPQPSASEQAQIEPALVASAVGEGFKIIGPLRVEIPMFNIFLNESDELSRRLAVRLAEWATEPKGPPGEAAEALAHSLAGSSAAVGHASLSALARSLEHAIARSNQAARVSEGETALYPAACEEIRRLLQQFAAGFLAQPAPELIEQLEQHQPLPAEALPQPEAAEEATQEATLKPTLPPEAAQIAAPEHVEVPVLPLAPVALSRLLPQDDDIDLDDAPDAELFAVFREEAEELLPQLQARMREWAAQPADRTAAAACMRTLHTYKGAARLAGAMRQGEMAHRLESAVEQLANAEALSADQLEPVVWRVDALQEGFTGLCEAMAVAAAVPSAAEPADAPAWPAQTDAVPPATQNLLPVAVASALDKTESADQGVAQGIDWSRFADKGQTAEALGSAAPVVSLGAVRVQAGLLDRLVNHAGESSIARTRIESDLSQIKTSLADLNDNLDRLRRQLRDLDIQAETQISSRMEAAKVAAVEFDPLEMDRYTRVQELTRMMAESVNDVATVQRSLQRALQSSEDQVALQGRLMRSMQDDLLRTRMVEFESLADRLYRVVRQAAKETGKQVSLDIVGGTIELDRGVLERMTAPFEHLLRNSMAHGIETPVAREAAGKPAVGLIEIRLEPEGNEVSIEVRDDGAGLDLRLIRERAAALGLVPAQAELSDAQAAELIFAPGVSTAERVSELAGRGVGMDVVRSEVLALGGRIQTESLAGQGTRFRLILPLTTAVTQVLMLRAGALTVAVPSNLVEQVQHDAAAQVERAYRDGFVPLGDERVPFHALGALLSGEPVASASGADLPVVIVRSAAQRVAVHVDEVLGQQEVVVKNLGPQLGRLPGLAGMTLLASGAIAAIYNPVALVACYGPAARRRVEALLAGLAPGSPVVVERVQPVPPPLVLVVDDSLTVRRVTQRLLVREGYRVALAKDGQDALEQLAQERPRVILSDIEMPRMDGFEFVRRLRADPALADLPVIMITSRIAKKHRDLARDLGARHYLGKPYGEEELLAAVASQARAAVVPAQPE